MDPISERITGMQGTDRRARRAWGGLTMAVTGVAAFAAFLNGSFVVSAESASPDTDSTWVRMLAQAPRQTVTVPGDFRTLQTAIDSVADGTTILVAPGTYAERIELSGRSLHLWGVGGSALTRLVGDGSDGPVARVRGGSVQFDGISFQGGLGERGRGAVIERAAATFSGCRFERNAGGVEAVRAQVSLVECDFDGNRAAFAGGALLGEDSGLRVERCALRDNVAVTFGGGVSMQRGTLRMIDTTVTDNRVASGAWGGGLYAEGSEIVVQGGAFDGNRSAELGAGAYLLGGFAEMRDVRFVRNVCGSGTGLHGEQAELRLQGETIVEGAEPTAGPQERITEVALRPVIRRVVPAGRGELDDCTAGRGEFAVDCNGNGIDDGCEISHGLAMDTDGDGRIDGCQAREAEATALASAEPDAP